MQPTTLTRNHPLFSREIPEVSVVHISTFLDLKSLFRFQQVSFVAHKILSNPTILRNLGWYSSDVSRILKGRRLVQSAPTRIQLAERVPDGTTFSFVGEGASSKFLFVQSSNRQLFLVRDDDSVVEFPDTQFLDFAKNLAIAWSFKEKHLKRIDLENGIELTPLKWVNATEHEPINKEQEEEVFQKMTEACFCQGSRAFLQENGQLYVVSALGDTAFYFQLIDQEMILTQHAPLVNTEQTVRIRGEKTPVGRFLLRSGESMITCNNGLDVKPATFVIDLKVEDGNVCVEGQKFSVPPPIIFRLEWKFEKEKRSTTRQVCLRAYSMIESGSNVSRWSQQLDCSTFKGRKGYNHDFACNPISDHRFVAVLTRSMDRQVFSEAENPSIASQVRVFSRETGDMVFSFQGEKEYGCTPKREIEVIQLRNGRLFIDQLMNESNSRKFSVYDLSLIKQSGVGQAILLGEKERDTISNQTPPQDACFLSDNEMYLITASQSWNGYSPCLLRYSYNRSAAKSTLESKSSK